MLPYRIIGQILVLFRVRRHDSKIQVISGIDAKILPLLFKNKNYLPYLWRYCYPLLSFVTSPFVGSRTA